MKTDTLLPDMPTPALEGEALGADEVAVITPHIIPLETAPEVQRYDGEA